MKRSSYSKPLALSLHTLERTVLIEAVSHLLSS